MLGIKRLAALPDCQGNAQQLGHDMADGDAGLVGVLGTDALIERADRGVVLGGAQGGHPQIAADQVVAALGHDHADGQARLAVAIDAAGGLHRKNTEKACQLGGQDKTVRIDDLGGEDRGGDRADAGDGVQVVGRQLAIGFDQQFFESLA